VNRLFIELYLDEDVHVVIADLLRGRGFIATTALDEGQLGKTDEEQLTYSIDQKKTLLTHNRQDFEALARKYAIAGKTHFGIILAVRRSPYEIVRRIMRFLNHVTVDEMKNQVRYI